MYKFKYDVIEEGPDVKCSAHHCCLHRVELAAGLHQASLAAAVIRGALEGDEGLRVK